MPPRSQVARAPRLLYVRNREVDMVVTGTARRQRQEHALSGNDSF